METLADSYQVCVGEPFPSFDSIHAAFMELMQVPDFPGFKFPDLRFPDMPTLSFPPFSFTLSFDINLNKLSGELMRNQLLALVDYVYGVLKQFVDIPLPSLPNIGDLTDLLSNKAREIMDGLLAIYNDTKEWVVGFSIPNPLFPSFSWPDFEVNDAFQLSVSYYLNMLNDMLFSMVNAVADLLELPGMPSLPKFPSIQEIMDLLPDFPTLDDLKGLTFDGFSFKLSIPDPLFPTFSMPEIEFIDALKTMITSMAMEVLKSITDFITDVLGIALSFPLICIPLTFAGVI